MAKRPKGGATEAAGQTKDLPDTARADIFEALETGGDATAEESRHQRVKKRAYDLWEREGRQHGTDERHWHDAVREIDEEDGASSPPA